MRHAHRGDALGPARVRRVGQVLARQRGDGHGAFALAIDLHELLAHGVDGAAQVVHIHGTAAVDDGLEAVHIGTRAAHVLHQPVHHGGRRKQRQAAHVRGQLHQLGRIEPAGRGHHMARAAQHVGVVVQARAMRHGRGIDHGVAGLHVVHVGEVGHGHGQQVAVRLHHPLGPPGGARGVEQRGHVVGGALLQRQRRALRRLLPGGCPQHLHRRGVGARSQRRIVQRRRHAHHARAAVGKHVSQLARMQLVVDGHRDGAAPVDGVQRLQILRTIGREDGHAFARLHAAMRAQVCGQRGHARGKGTVVVQQACAGQQRGPLAMHQRAALQQVGNVHGVVALSPGATIGKRRQRAQSQKYTREIPGGG